MGNLQDIAGASVPLAEPNVKATVALPETKASGKQELANLELEAKRLEIEERRLAVLEKKANVQDLEERLAERELKRETVRQRSKINGETLKQLSRNDDMVQKRCNHKKGGNGANGVIGGQGDDSQYAVMKHTFANGDMWVRCLRCGKTWKPVNRTAFASDELYLKAVAQYEAAVNFQTRNVPSSSIQFRFSDNGDYYRQVTDSTNLR
jgi:hypothetical protein